MTAQLKVIPGADHDQRRDTLVLDARRLTAIFCRECAFKPLPYMAREFARYLAQGYETDMLEEVIRLTSWAPRPSFAYFNAIMRNHIGEYTLTAFVHHDRSTEYNPELEKAMDGLTDEDLDDLLGAFPLKPLSRENQKHQEG